MKTRRQLPVVGLAGAAVDAAGSSWPVSARSRCNSRWPTVHLVMINVEPVAGPLSVIRGEVDVSDQHRAWWPLNARQALS